MRIVSLGLCLGAITSSTLSLSRWWVLRLIGLRTGPQLGGWSPGPGSPRCRQQPYHYEAAEPEVVSTFPTFLQPGTPVTFVYLAGTGRWALFFFSRRRRKGFHGRGVDESQPGMAQAWIRNGAWHRAAIGNEMISWRRDWEWSRLQEPCWIARCCERRMKAWAWWDRGPPKSPLFMKGKRARGRLPREHAIAALRCVFLGVQAACLAAFRWCRQRIAQCRHRLGFVGGLYAWSWPWIDVP